MDSENLKTVTVWDPLVRVCHWSLAIAFFTAYIVENDVLTLHVWAGYLIGLLVVLRVLWGFIGPKYARFSSFIYGPGKVWGHLVSLFSFRAKRYIGHNPAGGAMTLALIAGLAMLVWTGLETYAVEENAGPLTGFSIVGGFRDQTLAPAPKALTVEEKGAKRAKKPKKPGKFWEDIHEVLANIVFALVIVHIAGVLITSFFHRENLPRAMITGKKNAL